MKTILSFAFVLLISFSLFAQTDIGSPNISKTDNNLEISFTSVTIAGDSGDYFYSDWFKCEKFDGLSWTTYPIRWFKTQSSTSAKPHITFTVEGTYDGTTISATDTLGAVGDSLETAQIGTCDFNGYRYDKYRFKITTADNNPLDCLLSSFGLLFTMPEN